MEVKSGSASTLLDPPRRPDNRCARYPACKNPLPEITPRHRRYGGEAVAADPFCSSWCCREWHGTQVGEKKVA